MAKLIKGLNPLLTYIGDLLSLYQVDTIKVPIKYREQVLQTKKLLEHDTSGIVNTILDFAIKCALVKYSIDSTNSNLRDELNSWLDNINSDLRGKIPTGLEALAKEYFRERWKGSSQLLLRTFWTKKDNLLLPTTLFFVDGEDIKCKTDNENGYITLGEEKYFIRVSDDDKDDISLPKQSNDIEEIIYVQKPYDSWGTREPVPFFIRRGLFRNLSFYELLTQKGEYVVGKALEYLFAIKKGTEKLTLEGRAEHTYSEPDLKDISDKFKQLMENKKIDPGTPTYTTNFDTQLEHMIPEYDRILKESLFTSTERRLLAGLGLIDIVQGVSSTRRESTLNPKPLISEIEQGVKDFSSLLTDIVSSIKEKNKISHPKWMNAKSEISTTPIKQFIDSDIKQILRSAYDRGGLSKKTFIEVVCELDYEIEVRRRKEEKANGEESIMFAPVIQNTEAQRSPEETPDKDLPEDKKGPEADNYLMSSVGFSPEITKNFIRLRQRDPDEFDKNSFRIITLSESKKIKAVIGKIKGQESTTIQSYLFDREEWSLKEANSWIKKHRGCIEWALSYEEIELEIPEPDLCSITYEEAPYKDNFDLPPSVKKYPKGAQTAFRSAFNKALETYNNEQTAFRVAWSVLKKWILKHKSD